MNGTTLKMRLLAICSLRLLLGVIFLTGPAAAVETGAISMPSGLDIAHLKLVDANQQMRVYVSLLGYDNATGGAVVYPGEAGAALGNVTQMNRRLMDMIGETRRFQVFDDSDTGIRSESDIVITGQITRAVQRLERFLRGRKAVTSIGLSIQIKNSETGVLIDQHQAIENYGQRPGEGALALTATDASGPDFTERRLEDWQEAFTRVLEHAAAYFESSMRPLARISATQGETIHLNRGTLHGLQTGDEFVLFSMGTQPKLLAQVRCDAVGRESTSCHLTKVAPNADAPRPGHYAILSDESLKLRFE